jgi:hypothetical protein
MKNRPHETVTDAAGSAAFVFKFGDARPDNLLGMLTGTCLAQAVLDATMTLC